MVRLIAKVGNGRVPLGARGGAQAPPVSQPAQLSHGRHTAQPLAHGRQPALATGAPPPLPPLYRCPSTPGVPSPQVKIEHTDLGGSFVKPQSAKDAEVALEQCERGGAVVLTVGLKPRPVRPVLGLQGCRWLQDVALTRCAPMLRQSLRRSTTARCPPLPCCS